MPMTCARNRRDRRAIRPHRPAVAHRRPHRRPGRARGPAEWAVLAFLAGDNDLEGALLRDLREMERVGSRPGSVEVLAQIDRGLRDDASDGDWRGSRRYYVTRNGDPGRIRSRLLAALGETNTGDPRVLEEFIAAAAAQYPARTHALVIGSHGSGVDDPPGFRSPVSTRRRPRRRRADVDSPIAYIPRRSPFFSTSRAELPIPGSPTGRGIAYDHGAGDCLDTLELERVLANAHRRLGHPIDLLGMDACLMTMLEVAYQVRRHARIVVGSEEVEPADGWPHDAILADLTARPAMTAGDLARGIVRRYAESCRRRGQEGTLVAVDLAQLDDLVGAVDVLAGALLPKLRRRGMHGAVEDARRRTVKFSEGQYVDLHDFCRNLNALVDDRAVRAACAPVQRIIDGQGAPTPVLENATVGARLRRARGLSIYFPAMSGPLDGYRRLAFARRTRWAELLVQRRV